MQLSACLLCCLLVAFPSGLRAGHEMGTAFEPDARERTKRRPELEWDWGHTYTRVTVDNQRVSSVLSHMLRYNFTLPRVQLQRGVVYMGAASRLRRVIHDALSGKPIKVGIVGGSVSWGQGASVRGETDWFSLLGHYLVRAFPNTNVTTRNGCTPGVPSSYMIMCLELSVDTDVDLVLTEYTLNDGHDSNLYSNAIVKGMERLIRRIMALPKRPAVIMMHHMTHYMGSYPPGHPKHFGGWRHFYESSEDAQGALAQYYDAQSLSQRTSLYRLAAFKQQPGFLWENFMADFHAGDLGHAAMADLVVYLLQQVALDLLLHPFGPEDEAIIAEGMPQQTMYTDNNPPYTTMCHVGDSFKNLTLSSEGWEYINEGRPDKPKWGWVTSKPGSMLSLRLDTDRSHISTSTEPVKVFLQHLRSYENMGMAEFSCTSGCTCEPVTVDAHITMRVSQLYLAELKVSQSKACVVSVKVLDKSSSGGGTKFKLAGVMLAERPGVNTGLRGVSGHNEAFGLSVHTGDVTQVTISKDGRRGGWGAPDRRRRRGNRLL
ncbi:hypothetical protein HYH02_015037 [Chlamydomonas schloesseri]|uniref:SGNH hydrolase-type esterase domain-containing protein n=1 Tax=Chlamydomonas schloesseri TaxID=2026947 RepID=A0A835SRD3_9CHLO|nr:hypothetical protein HYH02_015037 [Chlamydomonas schloesseri]|eukprot:KAG2425210.1 hypothetical protein HYH02_015037 [Chlamydomonas schloesseri]